MAENQNLEVRKPEAELERLLLQGLAGDASTMTQKDRDDLRAELGRRIAKLKSDAAP